MDETTKMSTETPPTAATFPLLNFDPTLLEKIITKLDVVSYFRLLQSCRSMNNFIQRSSNISIHASIYGETEMVDNSEMWIDFSMHQLNRDDCISNSVSLSNMVGIRMDSLVIRLNNFGFEAYYQQLKKYKIKSTKLSFGMEKPTTIEFAKMIQLLGSSHITISTEMVDMAMTTPLVKDIFLIMESAADLGLLNRILARFVNVDVCFRDRNITKKYGVLKKIIQAFVEGEYPLLNNFWIDVHPQPKICGHGLERFLKKLGLDIDSSWACHGTHNLITSLKTGTYAKIVLNTEFNYLELEITKEKKPAMEDCGCENCSEDDESDEE